MDIIAILLPLIGAAAGILPIASGLVFGTLNERKHLRELDERERRLAPIQITSRRFLPPDLNAPGAYFVEGHVVIGADYFKAFVAGLLKLIGGEIIPLETVISRARREALCRLKEHAARLGADQVYGLRIETCKIGGRMGKVTLNAEVYAYGTAIAAAAPIPPSPAAP